jgi:hypothetical protein
MRVKEYQHHHSHKQGRWGGGILLFISIACNGGYSNWYGDCSMILAEAFVFPPAGVNSYHHHRRRQQTTNEVGLDFINSALLKHPCFIDPLSSSATCSTELRNRSSRHHGQSSRLYATLTTSSAFNNLNEFNVHLEKLADKCGSMKEPVISRAAECQELWDRHRKDGKNGESIDGDNDSIHFEPDIVSFRNILTAWSKCARTLALGRHSVDGMHSARDHPTTEDGSAVDVYTPLDAAKRATTLLLAHPEPDLDSYNIVVDAWSKSRVAEAPEAAERLLRRMLDADTALEPNTRTYNLLIEAWANSNKGNSLEKVMQIYGHMGNLNKQGKDVTPNIRTINAVLHAHAKRAGQLTTQGSTEGFEQARACADTAYGILQDAKKRYEESGSLGDMPDVETYTSVMDVYSRCGTYGACRQTEDLLEELKELHVRTNNRRYKPNFRTYTAAITAWSRTRSNDSPKRVEELLEEMARDPVVKPNSKTYTVAIQCWARSRDPLKAKRVLKILMDLREQYKTTGNAEIRPTTQTYNNAIDACARCQGSVEQQTEAMKIAFAVLKTIETDKACNPNAATYSTLIRALSFLMPPGKDRDQLASMVFEKAKNAGLVDFACVKNLHRSVDRETLREQLDGNVDHNGVFKYEELPQAWSTHVPPEWASNGSRNAD